MSSNNISFQVHDMIDDIVQANTIGTDFPSENNITIYSLIRQVTSRVTQNIPELMVNSDTIQLPSNNILIVGLDLNNETNQEDTVSRQETSQITVNSEKYKDVTTTYTTCAICTEDFVEDDDISKVKCNHIFHTKCITEWGHYKCECPTCRQSLRD